MAASSHPAASGDADDCCPEFMVTASEEELAYLRRPVVRPSAAARSRSTSSIVSAGAPAHAPSPSSSSSTGSSAAGSGVSSSRSGRSVVTLPRDIVSCATQRRLLFLPGNFVEASRHPQRLAATLQTHRPYLKLITPLNQAGVLARFHALRTAPAALATPCSSSSSLSCGPARTSSTLASPSPSCSIPALCAPDTRPSLLPPSPVTPLMRDHALSAQLLRAFRFYADHFAPAVEYHARCHLPPVAARAAPSTAPPVAFGLALADSAGPPPSWARRNTFFLLYRLGTDPHDTPSRSPPAAAAHSAAAARALPVRLPPFQDEMARCLQPPLTGREHNKWFVFGLIEITWARDAPRGSEPDATLELHSHDRIVNEYIQYLSKYSRKQDRAASPLPPPTPPPLPRVHPPGAAGAARSLSISALPRPTQSMPPSHFH